MNYLVGYGNEPLAPTGFLDRIKAWWAGQSTVQKVAYVAGGAVLVAGVAMAISGGGKKKRYTANGRKRRRAKENSATGTRLRKHRAIVESAIASGEASARALFMGRRISRKVLEQALTSFKLARGANLIGDQIEADRLIRQGYGIIKADVPSLAPPGGKSIYERRAWKKFLANPEWGQLPKMSEEEAAEWRASIGVGPIPSRPEGRLTTRQAEVEWLRADIEKLAAKLRDESDPEKRAKIRAKIADRAEKIKQKQQGVSLERAKEFEKIEAKATKVAESAEAMARLQAEKERKEIEQIGIEPTRVAPGKKKAAPRYGFTGAQTMRARGYAPSISEMEALSLAAAREEFPGMVGVGVTELPVSVGTQFKGSPYVLAELPLEEYEAARAAQVQGIVSAALRTAAARVPFPSDRPPSPEKIAARERAYEKAIVEQEKMLAERIAEYKVKAGAEATARAAAVAAAAVPYTRRKPTREEKAARQRAFDIALGVEMSSPMAAATARSRRGELYTSVSSIEGEMVKRAMRAAEEAVPFVEVPVGKFPSAGEARLRDKAFKQALKKERKNLARQAKKLMAIDAKKGAEILAALRVPFPTDRPPTPEMVAARRVVQQEELAKAGLYVGREGWMPGAVARARAEAARVPMPGERPPFTKELRKQIRAEILAAAPDTPKEALKELARAEYERRFPGASPEEIRAAKGKRRRAYKEAFETEQKRAILGGITGMAMAPEFEERRTGAFTGRRIAKGREDIRGEVGGLPIAYPTYEFGKRTTPQEIEERLSVSDYIAWGREAGRRQAETMSILSREAENEIFRRPDRLKDPFGFGRRQGLLGGFALQLNQLEMAGDERAIKELRDSGVYEAIMAGKRYAPRRLPEREAEKRYGKTFVYGKPEGFGVKGVGRARATPSRPPPVIPMAEMPSTFSYKNNRRRRVKRARRAA